MQLKKKLSVILDSIKQPYLVVELDYYEISQLVELFHEKVENYSIFEQFKRQRDGSQYHLTVLSSPEYSKLNKNPLTGALLNHLKEEEIILNIKGIGEVSKNDQKAYFGVVVSEDLQAIRTKFGLSEKDFHITLGFLQKDIHFDEQKRPVRKNIVTWALEKSPSLKIK